jgi:hypothetical protein
MKKVVLQEIENKNEPFPNWKLYYEDEEIVGGNQICKMIERIDQIDKETNSNVEITLKFQPSREHKEYLKNFLFVDKPYFRTIRLSN